MSTSALCAQWLELSDENTTVDNVKEILGTISNNAWVAAAVADKTVDNVDVQRALLDLGLQKTEPALERSRSSILSVEEPVDDGDEVRAVDPSIQLKHAAIVTRFATHSTDELLCHLRAVLLERLDRLETYVEMSKRLTTMTQEHVNKTEAVWDELDPWEETTDGYNSVSKKGVEHNIGLPLSLSSFLRRPLLHTALHFALNEHFDALMILLQRHAKSLNTHRLYIIQSIPEHVHPADYLTLLPGIDPSTELLAVSPEMPWRDSLDWTETEECTSAFQGIVTARTPLSHTHSVTEVFQWYRDRINETDRAGLVDIALALVQHGASQGVPDLDEVGEELGLLARLVYDAPHPADDSWNDDWTLSRWRSLDPLAVVHAYLRYSTAESIADNIRRLAMPYLFVLESRAERAGFPDPDLVKRVFYEYVLQTDLGLAAAIFHASKPTLPLQERLIKSDEDMARLALACLYSSDNLTDWTLMSQMFECLPVWGGLHKEENHEADATLLSLGDFVKPSTSKPRFTSQELFLFFTPLSVSALSRVLDVFDVHLESGEVLARWNVPAPLRWFIQSANYPEQQRAWATRMSRRAGDGGKAPESEEEWVDLLRDMLKLVGGLEGALKGAFGLLSREEVTRIFFSGLLSSGNFHVAKGVLRRSPTRHLSDPQVIEDQVLAASREFYDNASSGNLHRGDMKLAYECLNVAAPSPAIQREREFIEATSRICSFNVVSRQGIPISPLEIRLVKDRLDLIARVLSSTEDAYKHSQVVLDLTYKLGFRGDVVAEVKVLAMLADAALQAEDFVRAAENAERMADIVRKLNEASLTSGDMESRKEANEVCWHSCFQLGRQTEFHDVDKKLRLLGHALELCPPEHILDVLGIWRKIEGESMIIHRERLEMRKENASRMHQASPSTAASFRTRFQDLQLGTSTGITAPDAAALASRTIKSVAASFPFSVRGRQSEEGRDSLDGGSVENESSGPDVSAHAKQAFARGIGWLIGADEEE